MDVSALQHLLDELLPSLESVEAQNGAILQFLKDKELAGDDELAPYLEQAAKAADVRWRAARLRMNRVLATMEEAKEESAAIHKKTAEKTAPSDGAEKQPAEQSARQDEQSSDTDRRAETQKKQGDEVSQFEASDKKGGEKKSAPPEQENKADAQQAKPESTSKGNEEGAAARGESEPAKHDETRDSRPARKDAA